ncbi:MAG: hypothetical protein HUU01_14470 [Saprospiraceae bacterium]|nr:hypothetical protein [Saprospiraceae bacterium]
MLPIPKVLQNSIIIFLFLPFLVKSQCYDDYFGFWKTNDGKFIKLIEPDPDRKIKGETAVGDRNQCFKGAYFYEDKMIKILSYESLYDEDTKENQFINRSFYFKVISVDKQIMKIRPISDEMKKMFGQNDITLFNEYFTPFERFELDSLYYTRLHFPYAIQIDKNGNMHLEDYRSYKVKKKKYFSGKLDKNQFIELKNLIYRSQITSMSNCEINKSCSDCHPTILKIFHNNKLTYYRAGMIHASAVSLVWKLDEIISNTKWKKIKKRKTVANRIGRSEP